MARRTDEHWKQWAELDPYYAVLSHEQYRTKGLSDNLDNFFLTGEREVSNVIDTAQSHFGPVKFGKALDFGSGVGRLTMAFAREFEEVVGVEISETMIKEAQQNCSRYGIDNAGFVLSDDRLSQVSGFFDFVNSYIVLQHIPVDRGMAIIEKLLGFVARNGKVMIHVSLSRNQNLAKALTYWSRVHIPGVNTMLNLIRRVPLSEPPMEMNAYDLSRVIHLFNVKGFQKVLVDLETHRGTITTARLYSCLDASPAT